MIRLKALIRQAVFPTAVLPNEDESKRQVGKSRETGYVLPLWRKVAYSTGTLGDSLSYNAASFYLLFYLTDTVHMAPADVGLMLALPAFLLFPLDPTAGAVSDRFGSRFGRRRVFLLICSPIAAFCFFLRFFPPPGWNMISLFFYWILVQIAFSVSATFLMVSYSAITAELSPSNKERAELVSMQQGFGILGTVLGAALTMVIVETLGGSLTGYSGMAAIYAALMLFVFMLAFSATRTTPGDVVQQVSVREETLLVFKLRAFRYQFGIWLLTSAVSTVVNALLIFYVGDVLGMQSAFSSVMLLVMFGAVASLPLWNHFCGGVDKRYLFATGALVFAISVVSLYFLSSDSTFLFWPIAMLAGTGTASISFLRAAMVTDLIAYDKVDVGRSRAGSITGLIGLGNRSGGALGSLLVGGLLALIGYGSGAPVTPQLREGLRFIISVVPSMLCVLVIVLLVKYPLTSKTITEAEMSLRSD